MTPPKIDRISWRCLAAAIFTSFALWSAIIWGAVTLAGVLR